jgi:hypothetical protein
MEFGLRLSSHVRVADSRAFVELDFPETSIEME